jgi:hypothetical protein
VAFRWPREAHAYKEGWAVWGIHWWSSMALLVCSEVRVRVWE